MQVHLVREQFHTLNFTQSLSFPKKVCDRKKEKKNSSCVCFLLWTMAFLTVGLTL